jgi:hypothetical protein
MTHCPLTQQCVLNNLVNSVNPKEADTSTGIPNQGPMRTCRKCGVSKPLEDFVLVFPRPDQDFKKGERRQYRCRECYNRYNVEWRRIQGARYRDQQAVRYHNRMAAKSPEDRAAYLLRHLKAKQVRYYQMKDEAYAAYGGYVCACCGETEKSFLSIDHVNNDGNEMRKIHGSSADKLYRGLKQNSYPSGFQVLCMNCQWGKVKNNGVCPHEARRNDQEKSIGPSGPKRKGPPLLEVMR